MGIPTLRRGLIGLPSPGRPLIGSLAVASFAVLFSSPSAHAASLTKSFTGFSDAFQPSQWAFFFEGDGTGSFSTTFGGGGGGTGTMTLSSTANNPPGTFEFAYDTAKLDSYAPGPNYVFQSGVLSYDWTWNFTPPTPGVALPFTYEKMIASPRSNSILLSQFNGDASQIGDLAFYNTQGTATDTVLAGAKFGFKIDSSLTNSTIFSGATATVTNFQFDAEYREVPGPLPAAAVVAAFGWSRKLRRRINQASLEA